MDPTIDQHAFHHSSLHLLIVHKPLLASFFLATVFLIRQLIKETSELIEGYVGSRGELGQICIFSVFMAMGQIARSKCFPPQPFTNASSMPDSVIYGRV